MKKSTLLASLMAAVFFTTAAGPAAAADWVDTNLPAAKGCAESDRQLQDSAAQSAVKGGVLVTGATPDASATNPAQVVIRMDDGRELLAEAAYGPGNRYSVRSARLLAPGGYPVDDFVVDARHMEGVRGDKDKLLAPGTRISLVDTSL